MYIYRVYVKIDMNFDPVGPIREIQGSRRVLPQLFTKKHAKNTRKTTTFLHIFLSIIEYHWLF